jgi:hypothetical protein
MTAVTAYEMGRKSAQDRDSMRMAEEVAKAERYFGDAYDEFWDGYFGYEDEGE